MNAILRKYLPFIYFMAAIIEISGEILRTPDVTPWMVYISKPVLMPLLMLWMLIHEDTIDAIFRKCIFFGLFFSLAGDVFLMFHYETFFIFGLGSFLVAQILYITGFTFNVARSLPWGGRIIMAVPYIFYIIGFLYILYGHIVSDEATRPMLIPVIVYASAIGAMGMTASWRVAATNKKSFYMVLVGALLFILSDSLIAINKFVVAIPYVAVGVMSTYTTAQFLITKGSLAHQKPR